MRRTEQVQGLRLMKFEEIYERTTARELSQHEAASILGVSERTFRRWRDRFEAEGAEGLYDRRLGKLSGRRVPVDTLMQVLELFDTQYWDFTASLSPAPSSRPSIRRRITSQSCRYFGKRSRPPAPVSRNTADIRAGNRFSDRDMDVQVVSLKKSRITI